MIKNRSSSKRVAIIGAGTSGLYLAWKLSEKGYNVTVFERRGVIGKEACSGLFSAMVLEFIPESKKLVQNRINFCLLHFPRKTLKIKFSKRFFVMSHYELDNLLFGLAESSGAKIIKNCNVTGKNFIMLQEEFDRIIGSDGANSLVRKSLNLPDPYFRLGIQGFTEEKNNDDYVDVWPTKKGFLWKIPRGQETEWGIIEKPARARKIFEEFLAKKSIFVSNIKSTLVPQGLIIPKNQRITLLGDSSGMTKPWSGGGVAWGLTGANLLLKNFPDLLSFRNEARMFFLPKIIFSKAAVKMVYFLGFKTPYFLPKNWQIESDFLI